MSRFLTFALICMSTACSAAHAAPQRGATSIAVAPIVAPQETTDLDPTLLRERLAARRALNLERLLAYAKAGVFPRNNHSQGPLNVFVDDEGHLCAAANLISLDGFAELVQASAASDNYLVLASVTTGPLMDWMLTSGFTQEEVALIQRPYMPTIGPQALEGQPAPEPLFVTAPLSMEDESERVRSVLLGVHELLRANTAEGLGLATARLESNVTLAASLVGARRFVAADAPNRPAAL